jgi:GTP cyclohydrolase I
MVSSVDQHPYLPPRDRWWRVARREADVGGCEVTAICGVSRGKRAAADFPESRAQIVEGPPSFVGACDEKALACFGRGWLGYVTTHDPLGTETLQTLVRRLARSFTLDGELASEVAEELCRMGGVLGAAVRLEAAQLSLRPGRLEPAESGPLPLVWRGTYLREAQLWREFIELVPRRS